MLNRLCLKVRQPIWPYPAWRAAGTSQFSSNLGQPVLPCYSGVLRNSIFGFCFSFGGFAGIPYTKLE